MVFLVFFKMINRYIAILLLLQVLLIKKKVDFFLDFFEDSTCRDNICCNKVHTYKLNHSNSHTELFFILFCFCQYFL